MQSIILIFIPKRRDAVYNRFFDHIVPFDRSWLVHKILCMDSFNFRLWNDQVPAAAIRLTSFFFSLDFFLTRLFDKIFGQLNIITGIVQWREPWPAVFPTPSDQFCCLTNPVDDDVMMDGRVSPFCSDYVFEFTPSFPIIFPEVVQKPFQFFFGFIRRKPVLWLIGQYDMIITWPKIGAYFPI